MTWLTENVVPLLVVGLIVEGILAVALYQTGRALFATAMGVVGVLLVAAVLAEWLVETDVERVQGTLHSCADALERNDADAVLAYIAPQLGIQNRIKQAMALYEVREVTITNLEIAINGLTPRPTAKAQFYALVRVRDLRGQLPYENARPKFQVTLTEENGRWLVTDYSVDVAGVANAVP